MSNYKGKTKPLKKQVKALNQDIPLPNEVEQLQAELRKANRTMKCWKKCSNYQINLQELNSEKSLALSDFKCGTKEAEKFLFLLFIGWL